MPATTSTLTTDGRHRPLEVADGLEAPRSGQRPTPRSRRLIGLLFPPRPAPAESAIAWLADDPVFRPAPTGHRGCAVHCPERRSGVPA